jgi:hypothetical protein
MVTRIKKLPVLVVYMIFLMNLFATAEAKNIFAKSDTTNPAFDNDDDRFFEDLFSKYPGKFDSVILHRIGWNVQIVYTQIDWGKNGVPSITQHYFNKKDAAYFYPSTTLNLPIAMLALQKLHELPFPGIDMNTGMITESGYRGQTAQYNDANTPDGRPTIAQYIKEMLLGNDENAFNRLYEFLGQDYINKQLAAKGYPHAQVLHRLGIVQTEDENRHTNPVSFYNKSIRRPIYQQLLQNNLTRYEKRNDFIGKAHLVDTGLVYAPMNFSQMNRMSLTDLNNIMISLLFPEKVKAEQRFSITEEDRRFLLKYMSQLPTESTYPSYDSNNNDAASKYIFYGGNKTGVLNNVRLFNVTGKEYGQLSDIAYVVDFENKIAFIVSAAIYCNKDEILNDDEFDYNSIGLPFMRDLGKALYDHELKRKRNTEPNLSSMIFIYDK